MSFTTLYDFVTTSFGGIVDSLTNLLVSLLVTPFPTLLSNLSESEGLANADFISDVLADLASFVGDIPMFNAPLLVILLGTFLIFFVIIAIARWFIP